MAQSILDLYDSMQTELGLDTISYNAGQAAITPYSDDDTYDADINPGNLELAAGGAINTTPYSSTVVYNP